MKRHLAYLRYVLRHKWFVFVAGRHVKVSLWRIIIHDWSKFLPSEWGPYAWTFYTKNGKSRYQETPEFHQAWNAHQKRNKHHWQYWLLQEDSGKTFPLEMSIKYIREMVADWMGAGRAITGKWECQEWYEANKDKMILYYRTRHLVEALLRITKP